MARYAQGYERKNSDSKNLIILLSSIVGVVLLSILVVILINSFKDFSVRCYANDCYQEYFITYDKIGNFDINENKINDDSYYVYLCDKTATVTTQSSSSDVADPYLNVVLNYLDEYIEKKGVGMIPLYLVNYSDFSSSTDNTNAVAKVLCNSNSDSLGTSHLFFVYNNNKSVTFSPDTVMTSEDGVKAALNIETYKTVEDWTK